MTGNIILDLMRAKWDLLDELLGMLPPACTRSDCSQIGEPVSHRIAENGFEKPTYATFKKVEAGIWEYCGDCFLGENVCSGIELPYL